ncbi:MAG: LOG family protein [Patescibacteria group bacterium]
MPSLFGTVPGKVIQEGEMKNSAGFVSIKRGIDNGEVEVKAEGLVVSTSGGMNYPLGDPICFEAEKLAMKVARLGGVLVNAGENGGTMLAITNAQPDITLHIVCPSHQLIKFGAKVTVNSYQTRKDIMTILPNVVVFPGKVGTFDELVNCLGWIKSLQQQNATPPNLWIHKYWWEVIELLNNKGAIQPGVWDKIHGFASADEINFE